MYPLILHFGQGPESLRLPPEQVQAFQELDAYLAGEADAAGISYLSEQSLMLMDISQDFYGCHILYWMDTDHWSPQGKKRSAPVSLRRSTPRCTCGWPPAPDRLPIIRRIFKAEVLVFPDLAGRLKKS